MKKILLSLLTVGVVVGAGVLATRAFFSDTEKSTGNVLQAGAIDLKVDNHSYYNGMSADGKLAEWPDNTWGLTDITSQLFFKFLDVKPGDLGEDTVSLHVDDNPSWLCADIDLTANDDVTCTEPEKLDDANCTEPGLKNGELADALNFIFWADDGDNVLEAGEVPLAQGKASEVLNGVTWALADSTKNIWTGTGPMEPKDPNGAPKTYYIGKAWCFGALLAAPLPDQLPPGTGNNPVLRGAGVTCDGKLVNNAAQTDKLMGDITFRAVQTRHNENYVCKSVRQIRVASSPMGFGPLGWGGWSCPAGYKVVGGGYEPSVASVTYSGPAKPGMPNPALPSTLQCPSGVLYPCYPHHTYIPPEEGWVVQNINSGQTLTVYALCEPV